MATNTRLSRLMKISWDIQRTKHKTRSKSLQAAWAMLSNEDIAIQYLSLRLNHNRAVRPAALNQMSIFNQ